MTLTSTILRRGLTSGLLAGAAVALAMPATAADYKRSASTERLINAQSEKDNWLMPMGDYGSMRYSKLTQINKTNVGNLKLAFAYALGGMLDTGQNGPQNDGPPLVDGGIMWVPDGWGSIYKLDVSSGRRGVKLWTKDSKIEHQGNTAQTRGFAMLGDALYEGLHDGRVVAINRDTGDFVWDVQIAGKNEFGTKENFNAAPTAFDGKIILANSAGDSGTRGWIAGLNATTGKEMWRFWTVPAPGEPGAETWKDDHNAWKTGGAGMWQNGSLDAVQRLSIWGTGNPVPAYDPEFRPGDNLFSDSAVALDVDTGKLKWYFQYVPNESWDYDEIGTHLLYDVTIGGKLRQVVGHYGRNGMFYQLDRTNGQFINGGQYTNEMNWTKGLDPKTGKPVEYDPTLTVQKYIPATRQLRGDGMERVCPTWHGGVAMQPQSYNPVKHIAYGAGSEGCFTQNGAAQASKGPAGGLDNAKSEKRTYTSDLYYGSVTAFDVVNNKVIAKAVLDVENRAGVLATAGDLIFTGLQTGQFVAYDDETLEELFRFDLGTPLKSPPIAYSIGPKQFIAFTTSGRHVHPVNYDNLESSSYLWVFSL